MATLNRGIIMKRVLVLMVMLFCMCGNAWGLSTERSGLIYYPTSGPSLISMNAAIESRGVDCIVKLTNNGSGVSTPYFIASDTELSEYITLERETGAVIHVNSGVTLDMGGSKFVPDLNQLWAGPGNVIGRFDCPILYPEMFGAVGDAFYFDSSVSDWYADDGFTTEATDDTSAINATAAMAKYSSAYVKLTSRYLVDGEIYLPPGVSMEGNNPAAPYSVGGIGSGLCAGWDTPSVFQYDNTWSNSVIRIANCDEKIGGNTLRDFAIWGSTDWPGSADAARCPRTAISQMCGIQSKLENLYISAFTKAGICSSASQDQGWDYLTIVACGTNESGTTKVAALEFLPHYELLEGVKACNAIHVWGMRMAHNRAWLHMDGGGTNLGHIDFTDCKFELKEWLTYESPPFYINSGMGVVQFTAGTNFVVNGDMLDEAGDPQYLFDINNYQTRFEACSFRGDVRLIDSSGLWVEIADSVHKTAPVDISDAIYVKEGKITNFVVNQNLSGVTERNYLTLGSNAIVDGITFANWIEATEDITNGSLIIMPKSQTEGHPIVRGLSVSDDGSGFRLYNDAVNTTAGNYDYLTHSTIKWADSSKVHTVLSGDTVVVSGILNAPRTPERVVLDYDTGLTISRIGYGSIGQRKSISISSDLETAGGVTIVDGFHIQTSTGANVSIASTADAIFFECLDGVIWREIK